MYDVLLYSVLLTVNKEIFHKENKTFNILTARLQPWPVSSQQLK